jgi:hypothetical protein
MQKHVSFNPYVEYQPCDINKTTIPVTEKRIISLSDRQSYLRKKKSRVKINYSRSLNHRKLSTSNLLLINPDKRKHINSNNIYIKDNKIVDSIEPMKVD